MKIAPEFRRGSCVSRAAGVGSVALLLSTSVIAPANAQSAAEMEAMRQQTEALQRQIEQLQRQLEAVRRQQEELKATVPTSPPEEAATGAVVHDPERKQVRVTLSGQVNRAILVADDGEETNAFFVDNDRSSTRLNLTGEADVNDDITAGAQIEVEYQSNPSNVVSQDNQSDVFNDVDSFDERKLEVFAESKAFGKLWLGQGDTASNETAEVDLSGTTTISVSAVDEMAGGIQFRDDAGDLSGVTIGDTFDNFDGLSRDDRVRYDTPQFDTGFGGLQLSGSAVADSLYDAALRYTGALANDTELEAAVAYAVDTNDDGFDQVSGSASLLLAGGFSVSGATGFQTPEEDDRDPYFGYLKFAYDFAAFDFGGSSVGIDYYYGEDIDVAGDESQAIGLLGVQKVDAASTELYLGARQYTLDRDGEDFDDIYALMTGARLRF